MTLRAHLDKLFVQCIGSIVSGKTYFKKGNEKHTCGAFFDFRRPGKLMVLNGLYSVLF